MRVGASRVGKNGPMTDHGGRHGGHRPVGPPLLGALVSAAAWVLLVIVAIDFGGRGRDGDSVAWVFLAMAGLGAAFCLVMAIFFGRQLLVAIGVLSDYQGKRARR
jgi:hypothetical protein